MAINDKFFDINSRDYLVLGNDDRAGEPMLAKVQYYKKEAVAYQRI